MNSVVSRIWMRFKTINRVSTKFPQRKYVMNAPKTKPTLLFNERNKKWANKTTIVSRDIKIAYAILL